MKTWHGLAVVLAGCGGDSTMMMGDDMVDPPKQVSALEKCVLDGGTLKELWSVGNQHGPVRSIVAGSLVVLGAQDGSVKQWSVDGDEPAYGKPFTTAGAPVAALALSSDAHILAATEQGQVAEWRLADAAAARTTTVADAQLSALAVSPDAANAVIGTTTGQLRAVVRTSGAMTPLTTTLWGASAAGYAGDRLFTAGHWYSTPQLERRIAIEPNVAVDVWNDKMRQGWVRSFALDAMGTRLAAGGDNFVATFAPDALAAGPVAITDVAGHTAVGTVVLPGGALFVTAGSEGTLRVWNAETATAVGMLDIAVPIGVAADTAGTTLFTSGPDGRLHAFGCQ